MAFVLAPAIAAMFAALGTVLTGSTGTGGGVFQPSDQIAMAALGLLLAAGILLFARPKVTADAQRIKIQNIIGGYDLPWEVVREIRFERDNPWLTLELQDDDVVAVLAVQATDKDHAVAGARALRGILRAHRAASSGDSPGPAGSAADNP